MKLFIKALILILATFFTLSAWSMEGAGEESSPSLPEELVGYVFQYLDIAALKNACVVSHRWNRIAGEDSLWAYEAERIMGRYASLLKQSKMWRELLIQWPEEAASHVSRMKDWTLEEVAFAVEDDSKSKLERALIRKLELAVIDTARQHKIEDAKGFMSWLIAHRAINLSAAWNAANSAAWNAARNAAKIATENLAYNDAWRAAKMGTKNAVRDAFTAPCVNPVWNATTSVANNAALTIVKAKLTELLSKGDDEISEAAWKLSSFHVLAHLSQTEFINEHISKAFKVVKEVLDNDASFNKSSEEILKIFAQNTWEKEKLKGNLFIASLQRIAEALNEQIMMREEYLRLTN